MSKVSKINIPFNKAIGSFLRSYRMELGLSLNKLNEMTGLNLSKSSLSSIECGRQQVTAYQLFLISKALQFSVDELFKSIVEKNLAEEYKDTKIIDGGNITNIDEL